MTFQPKILTWNCSPIAPSLSVSWATSLKYSYTYITILQYLTVFQDILSSHITWVSWESPDTPTLDQCIKSLDWHVVLAIYWYVLVAANSCSSQSFSMLNGYPADCLDILIIASYVQVQVAVSGNISLACNVSDKWCHTQYSLHWKLGVVLIKNFSID